MENRSAALGNRLREGLRAISGFRLYGPSDPPRTPTVSFSVGSRVAEDVASRLSDEWGLFLSHGDFYAPTVVERYGAPPGGFDARRLRLLHDSRRSGSPA
ncbi:MAG: hypothetical protein ABFS34_07580 [Gemmatimonadota bacterium]